MLIKIGKSEHIQQLQEEGLIYSNTIKYFRELEKAEQERCDTREGSLSSLVANDLKLFIGDEHKEIPIKMIKGRFHSYIKEDLLYHLYCLYAIKREHVTGKPFFDRRNIHFGDKALVVQKDEFINRLRKVTHGMYNISCGAVTYYNDDENQEHLSAFHKPNHFEYQSEYRFLIKERDENPIVLRIGNLEDISTMIDAKDLTTMFVDVIDD